MRTAHPDSGSDSPGPFAAGPGPAGAARTQRAHAPGRSRARSAANRAELERLFVEERGRLLFVAMRILQHPQEAEDAVQDGLLSAFKAIDGFRGSSQLSTWLHRVVVNAALMRVRRRKRRRECGLAELADTHAGQGDGSGAAGLEERIDARRAAAAALQILVRQPAGRRAVLEMRLLDGFNNPETAARLGITLGAVKLRLCRGRARLRASLATRLRHRSGPLI